MLLSSQHLLPLIFTVFIVTDTGVVAEESFHYSLDAYEADLAGLGCGFVLDFRAIQRGSGFTRESGIADPGFDLRPFEEDLLGSGFEEMPSQDEGAPGDEVVDRLFFVLDAVAQFLDREVLFHDFPLMMAPVAKECPPAIHPFFMSS